VIAPHRGQFGGSLRCVGAAHRRMAALAFAMAFLAGCATPQARFAGAPNGGLAIHPESSGQPVSSSTDPNVDPPVVRFQNTYDPYAAGNGDYFRQPMVPSGQPNALDPWSQQSASTSTDAWNAPKSYQAPTAAPNWNNAPPSAATTSAPAPATLWNNAAAAPSPPGAAPIGVAPPASPTELAQWATTAPPPPPAQAQWNQGAPPNTGVLPPPTANPIFGPPPPNGPPPGIIGVPTPMTDIIVNVAEAQTGRLLIGAAVNSDAGLTGQIILDEKNFDWRRIPRSWNDWPNAFRGGGQGFRIEALPGNQVQRYMVQFTEPYLFDTRVTFNMSGFLFDRRFFDWDEQRLGGRFGFGYRVTPDLSVQLGIRLEQVDITNPRVLGVPALDNALGTSDLYGIRLSMTQDTRDIPFAPTQGYYLDLSFEQVLGTFNYSRGTADMRRYFLVTERPDGSGRHVLGFSGQASISGSQTPIYDRYFAGGYSTLRGFSFRGATPKVDDVLVGGRLSLLGSVEYRLPVTADDALQAVFFCDYGTVEETINIDYDNYRVALGAGLRIAIPALSAAPIALDFAIPIARADTDEIQNFAFFVGVSR
jgi:outer membrane protein insertion porin family